jgi:hypothetical protein
MKSKIKIKIGQLFLSGLSLLVVFVTSLLIINFLLSSPATSNSLKSPFVHISKEIVKIENREIPIIKAEINLNHPDVVFDIISEVDVNREGGFSKFSKISGAAFLANTTFKDSNNPRPEECNPEDKEKNPEKWNPKNWTTVAQGKIVKGKCSKHWGNGTVVLGIKSDNEPEMIQRSINVAWESYWFAITSCPRLLENGSISQEETRCRKKFEEAQRSAIGFSRKNGTLYHVITDEQRGEVTYDVLAKIMQNIGCDEAMGLEGGNGVLMSTSEKVYVDDAKDNREEVRAPIIAAYDGTNPSVKVLFKKWKNFQSK